MSDQRTGDALVEQNRIGSGCRLTGPRTFKRSFRRLLADTFRAWQIALENPQFAGIVALHLGAGSGDGRAGNNPVGAAVAARETIAGGQMNVAMTIGGACAFNLAYPVDG